MTRRSLPFIILCLILACTASAREFYWENPQPVVASDSRFPSSATNGNVSAVVWQEIESGGADTGKIWLSARIYTGSSWVVRSRFAGPFPYAGDVPSIASVTIDNAKRILVSAVTGGNAISVFISADWGTTFTESQLNGAGSAVLAPRVFVRADGGYLVFATKGEAESFSLVYARSDNGTQWTPFEPYGPAAGKKRAFLPAHAALGSTDLVVFQAFYEGAARSSYQLYSSVSADRGLSWSEPKLVSSFTEPGTAAGAAAGSFENYHNQRPRLMRSGSGVSLVWERARTASEKYRIYYSALNARGELNVPVEAVSSADGYCFDPDIIELDGNPAIVWFDNRRGVNRVYLAQKEGILWNETDLSKNSQDAVFGRLVAAGNDIEVYWQQAQGRGVQRIVRLAPDRTILPPVLSPLNFARGSRARGDFARLSLRMPEDSSGIAGYSYAWSYGSQPEVPSEVQYLPEQDRLDLAAETDGSWYLGVRVADYAGNWSRPAYIEYNRDTIPPASPLLAEAGIDPDGFLASNTFSLSWEPAEEDLISGYTWSFDYIAPADYLPVLARLSGHTGKPALKPALFDFASAAAQRMPVGPPPASVLTKGRSVSFANKDNGIYAFSVAAVDSVGNIGKATVRYYVLNKYVPFTYITFIDSKVDDSGTVSLSVIGRGFSENGLLDAMYLDRDGREPWDLTLTRSGRQFAVTNDRLVSGVTLSDVEEGIYRIGLLHPARGLYFSKPLLTVTAFGTVKFGDYRYEFVPPWTRALSEPLTMFRPDRILLYSVLAFAIFTLFFSIYGITGAARDTLRIHEEVQALITGDIMPSEKKKRSVKLRKKGVGLRFKLAFFTTTLVISVVLIVSLPLGFQFSANQEKTLARGLESRVKVLLESLASGARAYLPSQNILELGFLPGQMTALEEAVNATVTGNIVDNSATGIDFVWATNDPAITEKIDTAQFVTGKSRLVRSENDEIAKRVQVLDEQAAVSVTQLSEGITSLTQEGIKLALNTDAESVRRRDEIQTISRQLEEKLNAELTKLSNSGIGSYPEYNPLALSRDITRYVFYKPVLYRRGSDTRYVHGTVRVEVSTESLLRTVDADRQTLVQTTVYIALFAVLMGVIGALVLASIIILPIRKLASHVAMIRDTEDKETLDGKDLHLRSRDEIGLLGETINDMTHGLVKAAAASKDLTVGKDLQKMFIPLETDKEGRKLTSGSSSDDNAEFFGYYEGAKGVSGDYFDYIKLDQRHYAIIKCDISGKGVPAALLMVEVATLFLDYFKDWKYEKNGFKLDYIVSRINDLLESRGFKGRFAAFTLCIFDSASGDIHFCNAGDNLVHIYDAATHKMKLLTLPESPAAGMFSSFLVDMKGGFKVVKHHLNPGDILFLYTDGFEEAKRHFRTKNLEVVSCAEPGLAQEAPHGSHSVGMDNEELGPERVIEIIEAVFGRKTYTLTKWHNPEENEPFQFDFTNCDGKLEDAIIALASVEKIFRMYRDPAANEFSRVQADRKIDKFLSDHFKQYELYCSNRKDDPTYKEYLYYTHVREDAQYDDLTILCIRKK